jgi:hypothetical protein
MSEGVIKRPLLTIFLNRYAFAINILVSGVNISFKNSSQY